MNDDLHLRIDNRLLHGQVVQYWLNYLDISHLVIADDTVAKNNSMSVIYRMALPDNVDLSIIPVNRLASQISKLNSSPSMVLVKDVYDLAQGIMCGAEFKRITLGNVHSAPDRSRVTDSVYLSEEEVQTLARLQNNGVQVEIQTFPGEIMRLAVDQGGEIRWSKP
jgi:mannose/fructose/N-acetylgalactosamine-specific phosphotransferase system component IIB